MAVYFVDSSAMVKRWVQEAGTARVRALTDPAAGHRILVASLLGPEVVGALTRRQRNGDLTVEDLDRAVLHLRTALAGPLSVIQTTAEVMARASELARAQALRGADAVHLAAAMVVAATAQSARLPAPIFLSSDQEQVRTARNLGFAVEDPGAAPAQAGEAPTA